jgi:hypothetical protein
MLTKKCRIGTNKRPINPYQAEQDDTQSLDLTQRAFLPSAGFSDKLDFTSVGLLHQRQLHFGTASHGRAGSRQTCCAYDAYPTGAFRPVMEVKAV